MAFNQLGMEMWRLGFEAQTVIALWMMGMAGLWRVSPNETQRMVVEKPVAFAKATKAAAQEIANGGTPVSATKKAVSTLRRKTSANKKRLSRGGPTLPKTTG